MHVYGFSENSIQKQAFVLEIINCSSTRKMLNIWKNKQRNNNLNQLEEEGNIKELVENQIQ